MVAHAHTRFTPADPSASGVDEDVLYEVAAIRARGRSWEAAAEAVGWDVAELRRVLRHDSHFDAALARATKEAEDEAQAEGLQRLRVLLRDDDPEIALQACEVISRYNSEKRRDETKLAVETLRAETRLSVEQLRADGRATRAAERAAEADDEPRMTPEEEKRWNEAVQRAWERRALEACGPGVSAYLGGGRHRNPTTPPDEAATPVQIVMDKDALVGGRTVYWALPLPLPTDPTVGPFPRE